MAFSKKTWKDRISQYGNRRILTDVQSGTEQTVTVERSEGTISEEGDAFNAANMNGLENRINSALADGKSFEVITQANFNELQRNSLLDDTVFYMIVED